MTAFNCKDHEAFIVLCRYATCCGYEVRLMDTVGEEFHCVVEGLLEIHNELNLRPFMEGLDQRRTYWGEIVRIAS